MEFAEKLNRLRREKGFSQEQLAEKLNVSRQAVSKWETGEAQPDMSKLLLLCEVFDISMDKLCGKETKPDAEKPEASLNSRKKFNRLCLLFLAAGLLIGLAGGYFGQAVFQDKVDRTAPQTIGQASSQDIIDNDYIFDNLNITSFSFYPPFAEDSSKTLRIVFSPSISNDAMKYEVVKTDCDGNTARYNAEYSGGVCQCTLDWDYHTWFTLSAVISDGRNIYTAGLIKFYNITIENFEYQELWNKSK